MKKYFFIATAALAALASCSKVTPVAEPDQAISFQVANYASRTKATSIIVEGFDKFNTYAWYHNGNDVQLFMNNVEISQLAQGAYAAAGEWGPARPYYWPKVGTVSFYSYASQQGINPTVTEEAFSLTNYSIANAVAPENGYADNILVAEPALNKSGNSPEYTVSGNKDGVATLFTHMLAQVQFKVKLDATPDKAGYNWKAEILTANPLISVPKEGGMTLNYTNFNQGPTWTLSETPAKYAVNPLSGIVLEAAGGNTSGDPVDLSASTVVIPQVADEIAFNLTYRLTRTFGTDEDAEVFTETVPVTITVADFYPKPAEGSTDPVIEWKYNTKYTYTVTIKTEGENPILIDPAVAEWGAGSGEITVPVETEETGETGETTNP